jgi:anthranilate synthase/aminodeoxychorismate synthase-like glutamine amidotransferase
MLLLIDNYDSFTHNLARYFVELGQRVEVIRNDQIDCAGIAKYQPDYLVFSPGPCSPNEAGITLSAIQHFTGKIPMLGVCLGHQAIGQVFGANVINSRNIKHGKTSLIQHQGTKLFQNVTSPFVATRYHSLVLEEKTLSDDFSVTAWCQEQDFEKEVMAIEHHTMPIVGVQFHPESLLTICGKQILENFLLQNQTVNK